MTPDRFILPSLTRITDLDEHAIRYRSLDRSAWANGDYVAAEIIDPGRHAEIELTGGRLMAPLPGERLIGPLGVRHATLEATGTWKEVGPDGSMHMLTAAGLMGQLTSRSVYAPYPLRAQYLGHVLRGEEKATMQGYVKTIAPKPFTLPVILLVGTSMSAGKTTTGRLVTRLLKEMGKTVLAVKMTGAGRHRDMLALQDAGADAILDFVDVGLPSSICPPDTFQAALDQMLARMALIPADVAVVEIGSSPLEPYNGALAIERVRDLVRFRFLSASDPYAVYGVMHGFGFTPDLVTGPTTNTLAGTELVEKMCRVPALNLLESANLPRLKQMLIQKLELSEQASSS